VRACEQAGAATGPATSAADRPTGSIRQREASLREQAAGRRLEERLRQALAKADATLHRFVEVAEADGLPPVLVVEWSQRGQTRRYRSTVGANLAVVSSGICLSGRDGDFDLTSLVSVMRDAPGWA
jgi:hypothetical protein